MKDGARLAKVILRLLSGEIVGYTDDIDDGEVYRRFDQNICISEGKRKQPIWSKYKVVAKMLNNESLVEKLWRYFEN